MSPEGSLQRLYPRALWLAPMLGMLFAAPVLSLGLHVLDDLPQRGHVQAHIEGRGGDRAWYDHYTFVDPRRAAFERDNGVRPWWSSLDTSVRFFRPLTVATLYFEQGVLHAAPWMMHLLNLLLYGGLCAIVVAVYRRFEPDHTAVALAALLYALDDAHVQPVAWLAHRSSLLSACLGLGAVLLYDRGLREGGTRAARFGLGCFALAVLSAEGGLTTLIYLGAHALFIDRRPLVRRVRGLLPYLAIAALWAIVYARLDFGARGSGAYVQPLGELHTWLSQAPLRLGWLLGGQLSGPWVWLDDLGWDATFAWDSAVIVGLGVPVALHGLWRVAGDRVLAFWLCSGLLSLLPVLSAPSHERLLVFGGVGLWMFMARSSLDLLRRRDRWSSSVRFVVAAVLILMGVQHLVIAPMALAVGTSRFGDVGTPEHYLAMLNETTHGAGSHVVVVNAPTAWHWSLFEYARLQGAAHDAPARVTVLGVTAEPVQIAVLDAHTIELTSEDGLLRDALSSLWRGPQRPLHVDDTIAIKGFDVRITGLTSDGFVRRVRFTFDRPLDHPAMAPVHWTADGLRALPTAPTATPLRIGRLQPPRL